MSKINQLLNISSKEWPRITVAWLMTFLTRFGFIVGWSALIATFLAQIGIELLPGLFLANALLVMVGTLFFRKIIHKVRHEILITFTILAAAIFLISSTAFLQTNSLLFFGLILIAESVLLAQLMIMISLFNEALFSPLESQRTFPIIESAETIGGIVGGLVLTYFAEAIPAYKFIIIWAISLILILPIVLKYNSKTMDIPKLDEGIEKKVSNKPFLYKFKEIRKIPYLKILMIVILLNWSMMNVVEFQYTKAIQQEVYSQHEEPLLSENETGIVLASEGYTDLQVENYEKEIAIKLGNLYVLFNGVALLIQLIIASRIITGLGVISSMLIHPILALLNLIGLTLRFSFGTAVLTRGTYELTGLIFKNAYDSSYYTIPHTKRSDVKEIMQGIMKPLGAILGTVMIILIAFNIKGIEQTFFLNIGLIIMAFVMSLLIIRLKTKYTELSEQNLSKKNNLATRLNAIDVLAQKGHKKNTAPLQKILTRENEPEIVVGKILNTLGARKDITAISSILDMLESEKDGIRIAAARVLHKFNDLNDDDRIQSFTKYRIIDTIKDVLKKEKNETVIEELIHFFYKLDPDQVTKFLLKNIKRESDNQANYIRMLKLFNDKNLKYYLQENLQSKSAELRAASVIALWQFKELRGQLEHILRQMLDSSKIAVLELGIESSGIVKFKKMKEKIYCLLSHKNSKISHAAILALAQMEEESIIPHMISNFLNPEHEWFETYASIIGNLPKKFKKTVKKIFYMNLSNEITAILNKNKSIKEMEKKTLKILYNLYNKIGAHHEAHKIKSALDSNNYLKI